LSFIWSQFGCAVAPTRTPPAVIYDSEPSSIEPIFPDTVSYICFRQKIAELKGKIKYKHDREQEYLTLYNRVVELDSVQIEHEKRHIEIRNRATTVGAMIPLVLVGGFAVWGLTQAEGSHDIDGAVIGSISAVALLYTPIFAGIGALIGLFGSGIILGDDIKKEHKESLAGLITKYNDLDTIAVKTLLPDSIK
jgi:hypothetical protein